jgi:hypothetical protein
VVRLLERFARVQPAGSGGLELGLLVAPAGDVELPHPALLAAQVVAGEQRYDHEPLHRGGQVRADHLRELVRLAVELERLALDLLVVLELDAHDPRHLDRGAGGAGDRDHRVVVGGVDLLHVA